MATVTPRVILFHKMFHEVNVCINRVNIVNKKILGKGDSRTFHHKRNTLVKIPLFNIVSNVNTNINILGGGGNTIMKILLLILVLSLTGCNNDDTTKQQLNNNTLNITNVSNENNGKSIGKEYGHGKETAYGQVKKNEPGNVVPPEEVNAPLEFGSQELYDQLIAFGGKFGQLYTGTKTAPVVMIPSNHTQDGVNIPTNGILIYYDYAANTDEMVERAITEENIQKIRYGSE